MEVGLRFPSLAKKKKKAVVSAMGVWYMRMPCNAAVTFFDVWLAGGKKIMYQKIKLICSILPPSASFKNMSKSEIRCNLRQSRFSLFLFPTERGEFTTEQRLRVSFLQGCCCFCHSYNDEISFAYASFPPAFSTTSLAVEGSSIERTEVEKLWLEEW